MSRAAVDLLVPPAYRWCPPSVSSAGAEVADLAASAGLVLDGAQRLVLDVMCAERGDGRWAAFEVCLVCPRQNMKTALLGASVLGDLFLHGARLVVWTAHRFRTTQEAFRDLVALIEGSDHLRRRVRRVTAANGEEGVELVTGQRLSFLARSKSGGRGLSGDVVVMDEAFALAPEVMGALLPTLSARPNPQVRYASSAGLITSDVLRSLRDRGRPGGDPSLAYVEWCAPVDGCASGERCTHRAGTEGCLLDDEQAWRAANPALGTRIAVEHVAAERRALSPEEFARERLGWWDDPESADVVISELAWRALCDPESVIPDGQRVAFAVDVTPDRSWTSIAVVGRRPDGLLHVELVDRRRGTGWVPARVAELQTRWRPVAWMVDGAGGAGSLLPDLAGMPVTVTSTRDMAYACGALFDDVAAGGLRHLGQVDLDVAVRVAGRRQLGDAWAWSRRSSMGDISPLVAVTLARFGLLTSPERRVDLNVW